MLAECTSAILNFVL